MSNSSSKKRGLLLVISGPSGVGKTTITHYVEKHLDGIFSVSLTTRPPAEGDVNGQDYHFVGKEEFVRQRDAGELLEWAQVYEGCFYGTPRRPVEAAIEQGRLMILEIDVEGAVQIKEKMPEAMAIFVMPPSQRVLLERLRRRGRESEEVIQKRFAKACKEIVLAWESNAYDEFIINRDLNHAVEEAVMLVRQALAQRAVAS